jgi:hypothetical protein
MHEAATAAWLVETLRSRDPRRPGVPDLELRARDLLAGDAAAARGLQPAAVTPQGAAAGGGEESLGYIVRHLALLAVSPAAGEAAEAVRAAALSGAASLLIGLGR